MKFRPCVWGMLFAAIALGLLDVRDVSAQPRRLFQRRAPVVTATPVITAAPDVTPAPIVATFPPQPGVVTPTLPATTSPPVATLPAQPGVVTAVPYLMYGYVAPNPYVAPYPWYSILPPVNPYIHPGHGPTGGYDPFGQQQKTAEDYGYRRQDFDGPPRKRPPTPVRDLDLKAEARRVRYVITVPTADAILFIDGAKTKQIGLERSFVTPPLDDEKIYTSVIEVQYIDGQGQKQSLRESVEFFPGETVKYKFTPKVKAN